MKQQNNTSPLMQKKTLALKYLVVVMASMMTMPMTQADVAGKRIGDLEIYKPAEGGNVTITMMLDTSGSMSLNRVSYACDIPGSPSYKKGYEMSLTDPSYKRYSCIVGSPRFYYRLSPEGQWYRCGDSSGSNSYSWDICNKKINNPSLGSEYNYVTSGSDTKYYYKGGTRYPDRLTRLKDALFALMDSSALDSNKVKIGIGQYSSHSGSDNKIVFDSDGSVQKSADGRTGKILVPAAFLDDAQRAKIKEAVAAAGGGGGTPTANAYAEVGAYMLGTNTKYGGKYNGFAKSVTSSKSGGNYISPLTSSTTSSCDGRGIYFLTDGAPNNSKDPRKIMQKALDIKKLNIPSDTLPSGTEGGNAMKEVGAFARALRDPTINPLGANGETLTAVVGFGADFDVDKAADAALPEKDRVIRTLSYIDSRGKTKTAEFYNCKNISDKDARNACNWGAKSHPELPGVGGFGEGGFFSAQSTEDIINSITTFVSDLNQTLPATPSGTIIIPDDPYRADSQLAVAYYPTLQPRVADNVVIWDGNLKKYALDEGTLYGKNNKKLFKNIAGDLDKNTVDLWSDKNYTNANNEVESGGFYAQLKTPDTGVSSVRTLYVEDWNSANNTDDKTILRKFAVNASGKVTVDNSSLTDTSFKDTVTYNEATLRKLLNFLGFDKLPSTATAVKDMTLKAENVSQAVKVVGATIHSTPASVSYSATLDEAGRVTDKRDDYVLFGSSEGGLHLVNADDYSNAGDGGKEKFVIIPREMLIDPNKSDALVKGAKKSAIGSPNFGVDAPWLVTAGYKYDFDNKRVRIDTSGKGVSAYGGLRMGGEALYGVNLNDANAPKMLFSITPNTSGFGRMGQIWSKPTAAKIKTSTAENDTGTDVLVFGGGYDMCYENQGFQVGITDAELGSCSNVSEAKGNAVYIINAKTGELIWSASSDNGATTQVSAMKNSVVGGITTLDRDNDGFMDHLYFADLGGQVFRADFTNAGFVKPTSSPTATASPESTFSNTRVTKVLSSAYSGSDTKYNYRFYERPAVSFYRNRNPNSNSLFALVNVISGDRSSPLSKMRDTTKSDRLYGIMDTDVTRPDNIFYASDFTSSSNANGQKVSNLADNDLAELPLDIGTPSTAGYTLAQKNVVIDELKAGGKQGWYYPLNNFDGYGNVRYTKGIGKSAVIDSFLYTTVYNPDMNYGAVDACAAEIIGGSERQLYCLPYGICTDDLSKNGTGGFVRAGKGIQELTLGPRSSDLSNQRLLIGTQTLTERASGRVGFGEDSDKGLFERIADSKGLDQSLLDANADRIPGSGTAPTLIHNDRYTLQPKIWYEVD